MRLLFFVVSFIIVSSLAGFAQIKLPSKQTETHSTTVKQTPAKTTEEKPAYSGPVFTLKVLTNTDCKFYVDGELKGVVRKDDAPLKINLKLGDYQLHAVSIENNEDELKQIYTVDKTGMEKFFEVDMKAAAEERERRRIAERTAIEKAAAEKTEAENKAKWGNLAEKVALNKKLAIQNDIPGLNEYAWICANRKVEIDEAYNLILKHISEIEENGNYLDTYSLILFQKGRYYEAEDIQLAAITKLRNNDEPVNGGFLERLGDIKMKLGKTNESIELYKKAQASGNTSTKIQDKINYQKYIETNWLDDIINDAILKINWAFKNIEPGYDHLNKIVLFVEGFNKLESSAKNENESNSYAVKIPAGNYSVKIVNYALYNGNWEEHSIANKYSIDCIFERVMNITSDTVIDLEFDLDNETTYQIH